MWEIYIRKMRKDAIDLDENEDGSYTITGFTQNKPCTGHKCSCCCNCSDPWTYNTGLYIDIPEGYCVDIDVHDGDLDKFTMINSGEIIFKSSIQTDTKLAYLIPLKMKPVKTSKIVFYKN